ncbi:methyltransferase [Cellvibrio sp.]|uniref:methyltransferase n=1 Tax=Cellvibrio sp. TaxID=1965322 RepID=UPI003964814B
MIDTPTLWLTQQIQQYTTASSLWLTDENLLKQINGATSRSNNPVVITNRWDLAEQMKIAGFKTEFSDFDLSAIPDASVDHIFYRISKEKAVTHHLINESHRVLQANGKLWICGLKNEGIKTYIEKAASLFGCEKNIQKDGMNYSGLLIKQFETGARLNDDDYANLRECIRIGDKTLLSKPGQFGWNKVDEGSEFLISAISELLASRVLKHCLDLGCGYGYLTFASQHLNIRTRTLTDNNAAALATAKANCDRLGINARVVASDAGEKLDAPFDLILCNPPFHQGFSVDEDLTDKFLRNAAKLLDPDGVAYFVVNQFIALEKKAFPYFKHINLVARNKSFKIVELRKN